MREFFRRLFFEDDRPANPTEVCRTCLVLEEQLRIANEEKREMLQTITSLVKPKIIVNEEKQVKPFEFVRQPMTMTARRAQLEARDRQIAADNARQQAAKPDNELNPLTEQLEKELGVSEDAG